MKRFILGSLLVIIAGAAYLLNGSATVDSMNPFQLEYRYAVIDNDGKDLGGNKGRAYTVNTYDKDGNEKR